MALDDAGQTELYKTYLLGPLRDLKITNYHLIVYEWIDAIFRLDTRKFAANLPENLLGLQFLVAWGRHLDAFNLITRFRTSDPVLMFNLKCCQYILSAYPMSGGLPAFNQWRQLVLAWERVLHCELEEVDLKIFKSDFNSILNYLNVLSDLHSGDDVVEFGELLDICKIMLGTNLEPKCSMHWFAYTSMLYFYTDPRECAFKSHFNKALKLSKIKENELQVWELGAQSVLDNRLVDSLGYLRQLNLHLAVSVARDLDIRGELRPYGIEETKQVLDELQIELAEEYFQKGDVKKGVHVILSIPRNSSECLKWAHQNLPLLLNENINNVHILANCASKLGLQKLSKRILYTGARRLVAEGNYSAACSVYDAMGSRANIFKIVWWVFAGLDDKLNLLIKGLQTYIKSKTTYLEDALELATSLHTLINSLENNTDQDTIADHLIKLFNFPEPPQQIATLLAAYTCSLVKFPITPKLANVLISIIGENSTIEDISNRDTQNDLKRCILKGLEL